MDPAKYLEEPSAIKLIYAGADGIKSDPIFIENVEEDIVDFSFDMTDEVLESENDAILSKLLSLTERTDITGSPLPEPEYGDAFYVGLSYLDETSDAASNWETLLELDVNVVYDPMDVNY